MKCIKGILLYGLILALAVVIPACGPENSENPHSPVLGGAPAPSAQQQEDRENDRITLEVRQELDKDEIVSPVKIEVKTVDGVVTLRGEVPSHTVADRAQLVAQGVGGVRAVHSFLKVSDDSQS